MLLQDLFTPFHFAALDRFFAVKVSFETEGSTSKLTTEYRVWFFDPRFHCDFAFWRDANPMFVFEEMTKEAQLMLLSGGEAGSSIVFEIPSLTEPSAISICGNASAYVYPRLSLELL